MKKSGISDRKIQKEIELDLLSTGACWHTRRDYKNVVLARLQILE